MDDPKARPHDGKGRFVRTLSTAEREAEAARLRSLGWTYQRIADELGWANKGDAHHAVQKVLRDTVQEAADDLRTLEVERLRGELERLAAVEAEVWTVLKREHVTVSNGEIVRLDGAPLPDDGPVLQAVDRLIKIEDARRRNSERRAKLLGLDAPVKQTIALTDERAAAIEALVEELGE
ncbi:hypothetical protein [Streptomyces sp. Wh19]|uniref:hypothetical protein n=1 Tax=Streptomyces sp. Wh19 TaxID=3076629 RepID=UPI00295863E7|nr:hypothetical protein [Streptomyces sp. Wh19]MDV9194326.1 hypothetical protein [Streptomyces sp. Wh19]